MSCNRRTFFMAASGLVLGARSALAANQGANDRVRVAVIGTGGRARGLMSLLKRLPGNQMVAVCDVYEPNLLRGAEIAGPGAAKVSDYRRILDHRQIDAVVIGTPDHWHKAIALEAVVAESAGAAAMVVRRGRRPVARSCSAQALGFVGRRLLPSRC